MRNKHGFTILELMIVIAVIVILAGITIPNVNQWLSNHRLSSSAREIYSLFQLSRLRAVKENANVVVTYDAGTEVYSAFVDNGAGGGSPGDDIQNGAELTIQRVVLEQGVVMKTISVNPIQFNSRGFVSPTIGTTVTIENILNEQRQIVLSMTGHVRIL